MPQPVRYRPGQALTGLSGDHDDLTAMMTLMGHEIREYMADVEGQVAPDVSLRRWDLPPRRQPQREQRFHSLAAPFQRGHELVPADAMVIDASGSADSMFAAECLDPHAPGVVEVRGDCADRAM